MERRKKALKIAHQQREAVKDGHLTRQRDTLGKLEVKEAKAETGIPFTPEVSSYMPSISVDEFVATLVDFRWLIAKIVLFVSLVAVGYLVIAKPIYRVDALVEVKKAATSDGVLADSVMDSKEETIVNEQIQLLQSRKVLGKVVDDLKLDIVVHPIYFPIVGTAIARVNTLLKSSSSPPFDPDIPWVEFDQYAWSDERIEVESLDIPNDYLGKIFTLITKSDNEYQVFDEEDNLLTEGRVGVSNEKWLPVEMPHALLISEIKAQPGARFELSRILRINAIDQLNESLAVMEKGLSSGIVQVSLEGPDKTKITNILNRIVNTLVQQEIEGKSKTISRSLNFMEKQMPALKKRIEETEQALKSYRQLRGAVNVPKEAQIILERIVAVEAEISEIRRTRVELLRQFTPRHSKVVALDSQMFTLNKDLERLEGKLKAIPDTVQEMARLSRDAELHTQLYASLRNRIEQLRVSKGAPIRSVGIVDLAVLPLEPVKPHKLAIIAVSLVLGLFLGIGAAFLRKALKGAVRDPDIIEKRLGLPVYATVPHSGKQRKVMKDAEETKKAVLLAMAYDTDPAVESLRSFRTSLHFAFLEAKNNVILITGPTSGIGKTFLTANFGAVLASTRKRVLLIDGDLRKGHLNTYFGMENKEGLSDAIATEKSIDQVIRKTNVDGLEMICTGPVPPNPSELLLHEKFIIAVENLSLLYDYVIIDSPPVLPVTDAVVIGRLAGVAFLVLKAGEHNLREIEQTVKRLKQGGVSLQGVVFNDMPVSKSHYGYAAYSGEDEHRFRTNVNI